MSKNKDLKLTFDDKNFNKGTEYGKELIQKSLKKFGAGRSVLVDKNGRIIAGNKTFENFKELGYDKVEIIETDRDTLVAVKRNDIDLDTQQGREFALADNQTSNINMLWDYGQIDKEMNESTLEEWGVEPIEEIDLDDFFGDEDLGDEQEETNENKIVLEYTDEDYEAVIEALNKRSGTKESIIYDLLIRK